MQHFTFEYNGTVGDAIVEHYTEDFYNRYRITLEDDLVIIAPTNIAGMNMVIWIQVTKRGDKIFPHELVQALGQGLEDARIY